jgi:hypothetical protein
MLRSPEALNTRQFLTERLTAAAYGIDAGACGDPRETILLDGTRGFADGQPGTRAKKPPLLPEKDVAPLANELSGETAKRSLEGIARFHRQRGSQGFVPRRSWWRKVCVRTT